MDCLEAREAMITPTFSYPGYGAFFRYGVVGPGFVGSPMGVKRNALSLTTLASVDGGRGEMLIGALEASRDVV
jgi:hypothetical protein